MSSLYKYYSAKKAVVVNEGERSCEFNPSIGVKQVGTSQVACYQLKLNHLLKKNQLQIWYLDQ